MEKEEADVWQFRRVKYRNYLMFKEKDRNLPVV